jgi:hypothetical protein
MDGRLSSLIIDTVITLCGFAVVIYAALGYFVEKDASFLLVFLLGFVISCYGIGRRLRGWWE